MTRALTGSRVVVTRGRHQAGELDALLRAHGAVPVPYPCIRIVPPRRTERLDAALRAAAAGEFDRIVITSVNAVAAVRRRLDRLELRLPPLRGAAVGPATADAARRQLGLVIDMVPDDFVADALAAQLDVSPGERILLPLADAAGPVVCDALSRRGARTTRVEAYRTVRGSGGVRLLPLLRSGSVDAVTIASASAARHLAGRLRLEGGGPSDLGRVPLACIGPRTAAAARRHELPATAVATTHTIDGLVIAVAQTLASRARHGGSE